jgi:branched-chain amino acid transport system permease protein
LESEIDRAVNRLLWIVLALFAALPFALTLLTGADASKFWQGLLIQVFIYAIYALSYDLLFGYTGVLSFGHAMFFGTGAYTAGIALKFLHADLITATLLVGVLVIVQALVIGSLALRVKGVYFAMVTLAFAQLFFILVQATDFRQWTGAEDGLHGVPVPAFISPTDERLRFYYLALVACVLIYVVARRIVDSPTGRVLVAIRENEARAQSIGYNTIVFRLFATVAAGLFAAFAGMLHVLFNLSADSSLFGVDMTINALLMTIIGGAGTLAGPLLGAGVYQLLGYGLNTQFGPRWPLILGAVFVLLVMFLPEGIVGTWRTRRGSPTSTWRTWWSQLFMRKD